MRVFITGGAGFIGSHLCDTFVAEGKEVTILDNLSTGSEKNISHLHGKIRVFQGDIRNQELVDSLTKDSDVVLHMAAALGVNNILDNPIESISTNFHGSEIVLNAARKFDRRILIASTSEIYGKNEKQPLSEEDDRVIGSPQKLRWTYSDAKAMEEAIAYHLYLKSNLKVTTVRFFNTVGPRQSGRYGMVIPRFIKAALAQKPLEVFGSGAQSRVFCHVADSVRAISKILTSDNTIGEIFNVGGKEEISILNLAKLIINLTNSKSTVSFRTYQDAYVVGFEDVQRRVPNLTKIRKFIGWEPSINLENIINDTAKSETIRI
jgi:UDP-glucose 4-epimerase